MQRHPVFDELDASLGALAPNERVELSGNWLPTTRRAYAARDQLGTGSGPFVEVIDRRWCGTLTCAAPIAGVAFLVTPTELFWSKSAPAAARLDVDVSLHAYADYSPNRATFVANIGGALLPGIAVASAGGSPVACHITHPHLTTGHVVPLAHTEEATVGVLLLQGHFLKIGRDRLWRMREELASSLPPRVRELLTRRRSGSIPWNSTR